MIADFRRCKNFLSRYMNARSTFQKLKMTLRSRYEFELSCIASFRKLFDQIKEERLTI